MTKKEKQKLDSIIEKVAEFHQQAFRRQFEVDDVEEIFQGLMFDVQRIIEELKKVEGPQ